MQENINNCTIISVVNQKGGVGKTTTSVNLATAFATIDKRVLIIDLDPQGNASTGLGISQKARVVNIYNVLTENINIKEAIINSCVTNLDIVTSNIDLTAAEIEIATLVNREFILKNCLSSIIDKYDYIIIDCPPSLGMLTINALVASTSILIPLQCEFFALEGLSHLVKTFKIIRKKLNPNLSIFGVLLTMYDKRNRLTIQIEKDVREYFGRDVFNTVIPRNVKISEAPSHGKPAIIYDHKCVGSRAYIHLVREIILKQKELIMEN